MADKLLVRLYNVELGDFIYLQVPDKNRDVHIIIDCGTLSEMDVLTDRLAELKTDLPKDDQGKNLIDLLVVSHPHLDHHKGFTPENFEGFTIKNLWLSPAFDRQNSQAVGFFALKDAVVRSLTSLSAFAEGKLKLEVDGLLELNKSEIIEHLCSGMGQGITPLFASADTPQADLEIFEDEDIQFKILSPMSNIDGYYMGGTGLDVSIEGSELGFDFSGERMSAAETEPFSEYLADGYQRLFAGGNQIATEIPKNISALDFQTLRSRLRSNVLALAEMTGKIENNLSVVLLLEWHGKRLLFTGDAEWSGAFDGAVKPGRCNGAWNVMWSEGKLVPDLHLDFLKVGHHGSENATPWKPRKDEDAPEHPINRVLEAMLPADRKADATAVVSTERGNRYPSIPSGDLLKELARRVSNVRENYVETSTSSHAMDNDTPQPQRTDLELSDTGHPIPYIEIQYEHPEVED